MRADLLDRIRKIEFFCNESSLNHYRPAPPDGFVAYRSNRRRIFLRRGLNLDRLEEHLASGDAQEHPLVNSPIP